MKLPKYPMASSDKMMTFEFISEWKKKQTNRMVIIPLIE
jgi:hypothetical protein